MLPESGIQLAEVLVQPHVASGPEKVTACGDGREAACNECRYVKGIGPGRE